MTTDTTAEHTEKRREDAQEPQTAIYVYGIVPADAQTTPEARGVGDPPAPVELITSEGIAALISEIPLGRGLGTPDDYAAHARLLDATAAALPVLPLRFGAVLSDRDAVRDELLGANHEEFADALRQLDGRLEFIVKGRYEQDAVIREVLDEDEQAQALRQAIADKPEEATRDERIRLGELLTNAVAAKRERDTAELTEALSPLGFDAVVREPTHERDAVYVAYLVDDGKRDEFREAVDQWAGRHSGRITVRLLGPVAPYDFVLSRQAPGG